MSQRPAIEYPCQWSYRVIGESEDALREAVAAIVGDVSYEFVAVRTSTGGRYLSFTLTLTVSDEARRLAVFRALASHDATRYVL